MLTHPAGRLASAAIVVMVFLAACSDETGPRTPPPHLAADSGDAQHGLAGGELPKRVVIQLNSPAGQPMQGVAVHFMVAPGAGTISDSLVLTDAAGRAGFTWQLGGVPGLQTVTVSADGATLPVTATAVSLVVPDNGITAGTEQTCRYGAGGVACWGRDSANAAPDYQPIPPGGPGLVQVSSGPYLTCGIGTDSTGYCWGSGNLGSGVFASHVPVPVTTTAKFRSISVGGYPAPYRLTGSGFACGITVAGPTLCWGTNYQGELGDGQEAVETALPVTVLAPRPLVLVRPGGADFTCGLDGDGRAWCWGNNYAGQLGDGSPVGGNNHRVLPDTVAGGLRFRSLDVGYMTACGLTVDDRAYCWGAGWEGELGGGGQGVSPVPVPVSGGLTFSALALGYQHVCALTADGTPYCWGRILDGIGSAAFVTVPTAVPTTEKFVVITAGGAHSCGRTAAGATWCWGANDAGQVGVGRTAESLVPVQVSGSRQWLQVSAGQNHTCAVATDGSGWCWGRNGFGALGNGSTSFSGTVPAPAPITGGRSFQWVSAGQWSTCGVTTTGAAYCWGKNDSGILGDGTTTDRPSPVAVGGGLQFTRITTDRTLSCGIATTAAAYCWGTGILGNGSSSTSLAPVAVAGGIRFTEIGARDDICGLAADSTAWCWGSNIAGRFGDSTTADQAQYVPARAFPVLGGGLRSIGEGGNCAVAQDGSGWCAGFGTVGQLGNGGTFASSVPVPVSGGIAFQSLVTGLVHRCGLTAAGVAWCWGGSLGEGKLGDGTGLESSVPVAVAGGLTFRQISAGYYHTCGITTQNALYCWGANSDGQLGIGQAAFIGAPVQVP